MRRFVGSFLGSCVSSCVRSIGVLLVLFITTEIAAGPVEQAKRIHDRIAGVPPTVQILGQMASTIANGSGSELENAQTAAFIAIDHPDFYRTTLKNLVTPWTNRDFDVFAPLNDYTATVIGLVRDDRDFREVLTGDQLYVGNGSTGAPAYNPASNDHYEFLEQQGVDLAAALEAQPQTNLTGIPASAAAGVLTSRGASKAFFIAGTNRAMLRFTLVNHMCRDLEQVADTSRTPDRIRQDVTRSPGGDSRLFRNNCVGCHSGMDPMAQAFAYYNFEYDADNDPSGDNGRLAYNDVGVLDPDTMTRVVRKYHINQNNFPFGYVTPDDGWNNYWRTGINRNLGWSGSLPGSGNGAQSLGAELANSEAFASCQVSKVFETVCLRAPVDAVDRAQLTAMTGSFVSSGYNLKQPFVESAAYCRGE
ncbi:MAG: hypothetical protein ACI82A_002441 [Candidatus Azotimanducaceae bacterium]|jgi:hypothetical protein